MGSECRYFFLKDRAVIEKINKEIYGKRNEAYHFREEVEHLNGFHAQFNRTQPYAYLQQNHFQNCKNVLN